MNKDEIKAAIITYEYRTESKNDVGLGGTEIEVRNLKIRKDKYICDVLITYKRKYTTRYYNCEYTKEMLGG